MLALTKIKFISKYSQKKHESFLLAPHFSFRKEKVDVSFGYFFF